MPGTAGSMFFFRLGGLQVGHAQVFPAWSSGLASTFRVVFASLGQSLRW